MVLSRPVPGSDPWFTGWFDYRGSLLPLFDSSQLLGHGASNVRMSSRILVLRIDHEQSEPPYQLGLTVEHVLGAELLDFPAGGTVSSPVSSRRSSPLDFLGTVAQTKCGTVQLTIPARFPLVHN